MIGSGIAAQQLSPDDIGLELFENAAATAAGLFAIILMFGPVSGGHFNPVVSLVDASFGGLSLARRARLHPRPGRRLHPRRDRRQHHVRADARSASRPSTAPPAAHFFSEIIATLGLMLVIFSLARTKRGAVTPAAVGAYIGAAYFFTSSDQLRQPRDHHRPDVLQHVRRDRARIGPRLHRRPSCSAASSRSSSIRTLYPDVTPEEAADVVLPHTDGHADTRDRLATAPTETR